MHNILVTGTGSIIGYGIIESLRKSALKLNIFGIDINEDAYGSFLCDKFIKGVRADSGNFIDFINAIIKDHKIDLIFTGIEEDLYILWENKDAVTAKIVMNNDLCISLSKDKLFTYRYLSGYDINLIPTLSSCTFSECVNCLGLPFLLKPVHSSASKGLEIIYSEGEFDFFSQRLSGKCIYQKITGSIDTEYTIGIFGDGAGGILDYMILRRTLSKEGATNKAVLENDEDILDYVTKLSSILKPLGPLNVQIRKENGKVYLLEINPRISSSCSIRTLLGYNEPEMCIRYFLKKEEILPTPKIQGKVIRYISDYICQ